MTEFKPKEGTNYQFITEVRQVPKAISELRQSAVIALDTEATGFDPHQADLLLVQLAMPGFAYLFDARMLDLTKLKDLLEDSAIVKIAQNASFDYRMLKAKLGIEAGPFFDTMLAERVLTSGYSRENSLEAIARKYLGIQLEKELRETFANHQREFSKRQLDYAAADALVLPQIQEAQSRALESEGLMRIAELEFRVVPVVAEMELRGFKIDVNRWREIIHEYERKRDEAAEKIQNELRPHFQHTQVDLFGRQAAVVNLNSPAQILGAFRKVGFDLPSTGEEVLQRCNHLLAQMLLEYRGYEKILTAFGENLIAKINPKTGRIHPDYMQIGTDTGRFSCSNPNLQQIPSDSLFRRCFVAERGYKLVVADYSQIELRIMADLSRDPVFIKAFKEGVDLHSLTASQMFSIPIGQVTKEKRFHAKSINFGLMYGRGAKSLAAQLKVSEEEAQQLLQKYFATYKKVKSWLDRAGRLAVTRGYSETVMGRRRGYPDLNPADPGYDRQSAYVERQGKNMPIQGTSADMMKLAMVYVYEKVKELHLTASPVHTVHDELVVEAKSDQAEEVARVVEEGMERAGREILKEVPIKVSVGISDYWEH